MRLERINIHLMDRCNLDCKYCLNNSPKDKIYSYLRRCLRTSAFEETSPERIVDRINILGKNINVMLLGGEPTIYRGFVKLCKLLTNRQFLSFATNMVSNNLYEFCREINPERVKIVNASLHITELERCGLLEEFITKYRLFRQKGIPIKVFYIMYPPHFSRIDSDIKFCQTAGVSLELLPFLGTFMGKRYPYDYSPGQKMFLSKRLNDNSRKLLSIETASFVGKKCRTGISIINIDTEGNVTRCYGDNKHMGNLFHDVRIYDTVKSCQSKTCPCTYQALKYIQSS